jgi:hypothetical protein
MQRLIDRLDDTLEPSHDVDVPEPQDAKACRSQKLISPPVIDKALSMLTAVQFDDQPAVD